MTDEQRKSVMHHMKYWTKEPASESGMRVALLLHEWQGLHHMDSDQMKKVSWSNERYQVVKMSKFSTPGGGLSTFDFSDLTRLVFLAHDHCIRVHITPCNPQFLEMSFHPRHTRTGEMQSRHPTLECAVSLWREKRESQEIPEVSE